jgi:hypothetical protein
MATSLLQKSPEKNTKRNKSSAKNSSRKTETKTHSPKTPSTSKKFPFTVVT